MLERMASPGDREDSDPLNHELASLLYVPFSCWAGSCNELQLRGENVFAVKAASSMVRRIFEQAHDVSHDGGILNMTLNRP